MKQEEIKEEVENKTERSVDEYEKEELIELVKSLTAENEKLLAENAKVEEYKDNWYRARADFENFKKRNGETRRLAYEDGKTDVIKGILSIGDNLERALKTVTDEKTLKGLEMLSTNFKETLANLGAEEIVPTGAFDPQIAEAVMSVEAEEGENSGEVKQVFLKGYKLGGKIIRFAQVVVIK